ncbi:acetoacetate--CoA ligase [Gaiella occulta]|uniref:acetoacetate--CoA ligase n=1 Tax=Gaiella occulta TaxID=1002870 RepID=UPI000E0B22BD
MLWQPSEERVEAATITRYARWLEQRHGLVLPDYHALWRWSVDDLEGFWGSIWEFFDVRASSPYARVLGSRAMPGATWFPGARLNYAEHIFRDRDPSAVALRHASELRPLGEVTWAELRAETARLAAALRALGVERGDRVAAYLPNIPETVSAFLACASIGAVWSSCAPEFGARSVIDRFAQIEPKVLLAVDGYRYGGRDFDRRETIAQLRAQIPSLQATVVLGYLDPTADRGGLPGAVRWSDLPAPHGAALAFEQVPFDHPLWVLYSSGTTGLPKAIVHGHGGILLESLKKMHLHVDLHAGDRLFWFTTTGWMMWNFLVGGLLTDASIVLYDGSPAAPDLGTLWDLAEAAGISCFGTSAGYVAACMGAGVEPSRGRDLSALTSVGSTGSPLAPEGFDWVYEHVGADTWLFSTSGGTDVCTAFVGGVPTLPVYRGELQARALGAKVEAWDAEGRAHVGRTGELVITEPMPSMPLFFWNDPDGRRYRESYFEMYPGVWRHGDWIEITARGSAIISGRSDATINRGGVRIGTSEIYRAVLALADVVDALVVDVDRPGTQGLIRLFVVLRPGRELDDELRAAIRARIRDDCSPRHVPDEIDRIDEVPRTLSGKVLEVPVKRILAGAAPNEVASRDSLANPAALDHFVRLRDRSTAAGGQAATSGLTEPGSAEIRARVEALESEERALSARRRRLHDRIDFLRGSGGGDEQTLSRLARLEGEEREVSDSRRALHAEIDALRAELERYAAG